MGWSPVLLMLLALLSLGCAPAQPPVAPTPATVRAVVTTPSSTSAPPTATATRAPTAPPAPSVAPTATSAGARPVATATPGAVPAAAVRPTAAPSSPLVLQVSRPADDATEVAADARSVTVVGKSSADAVVSVNGQLVLPDASGSFQVEVPLDDEITLIEVVASDVSGAELRAQRIVVKE